MPITALPPNAVRAIGSSQALSDSASVVKELLDNAIDGRADRISIELSSNTLDDIRVKDNGHGIAPDDRAMLCTKYCTSKIRSLHDLENVGGLFLGFRGEALASAAELSGCLTITTRIEGEGTAVELKFDQKGQISGERRTSHPVGTTVKVEKYLQNLPVRRQAAEKMATKMLAKVKRMLQAYALARPHLRLSLKILKAKDRKGDWTYPKSGALSASRLEASFHAATDIFGKKLTSQCDSTSSSWSAAGEQIDKDASEALGHCARRDGIYTIEATMAKRECDGSALSNTGHFLSVDSRPLSCARGTLKQITSLYKSHLRSATSNEDNVKLLDPFLCLNIICPPGSYDANIEPAKDDILFTNSEILLGIVERLFRDIYGEVQLAPSKPPTKKISALEPHGIEMLLARKKAPVDSSPVGISPVVEASLPPPRSAPESSAYTPPNLRPLKNSAIDTPHVPPLRRSPKAIDHSDTEHPAIEKTQANAHPSFLASYDLPGSVSSAETCVEPTIGAVPIEAKPRWKGSMYAMDEEDEADLGVHLQERARSPVDLDVDADEHLRDVEVSNPWAFAKLNAAMRSSGHKKQLPTPGRQMGDASTSIDPSSDDLPQQVYSPSLQKSLPRIQQTRSPPEAAYLTPSPFPFPQKARGKRKADDDGMDICSIAASSNKERQEVGALDTWVQKSSSGYGELEDPPNTLRDDQGPPDLPYSRNFISARSLPLGGTPLSEIPDASQRPRRKPGPRKQQQGNIDRPFVPPVNDPHRVWFDIEENPSQKRPRKPPPNNGHQNPTRAPTINLRDDKIDDDESEVPTTVEQALPPLMHPDLAITLDYEARKQKASEAHRRVLREQAVAANNNKAQTDALDPLHPQHTIPTSSSPHKNRQAAAIAALHTHTRGIPPPSTPSEEDILALEPSDPRAYLLRIHQQQVPESLHQLRGKSRRQKTAMLPLETVTEEAYVGDLTLLIEDVIVDDVEEDMKDGGVWDRYIKSGEQDVAFGKADVGDVKRWEGRVREMVRELYAVKGEGADGEGEKRANVDVDLSKILQAHAVKYA